MGGQIQFTIALVMIGLFTIAVISFGVGFGNDNNSKINIDDDPELVLLSTNVEGNVSDFRGDSQSTYQSIVESAIDEGETTPSGGQFAITTVSSVGATKNILKIGYTKIFGTGGGFGIFITTFIAVLFFLLGMYLWKTWAGRIPD